MIKALIKTTALAALLASCNTTSSTAKIDAPEATETITYSAYKHDGRIYVISKPETIESFKKTGHMPYTRTFIGEGPKGETIVVEVDKKDNVFAEKLYTAYRTDFPYYKEFNQHGRIYIVGQKETYIGLLNTGHMPYTRTFIGEGPKGETIVVEVDKKDKTLADRLWTQYRTANPYYKQVEKHGRIYVAGQKETYIGLLNTGHMPYTKTLIGAGPDRKTVVFEVNKKDAGLTKRLIEQFNAVNKTSL